MRKTIEERIALLKRMESVIHWADRFPNIKTFDMARKTYLLEPTNRHLWELAGIAWHRVEDLFGEDAKWYVINFLFEFGTSNLAKFVALEKVLQFPEGNRDYFIAVLWLCVRDI